MIQEARFTLGCKRILFRWWRQRRYEMAWLWMAKHVPSRLVYWSLIHAGTCGTIKDDEEVPAVPFTTVLGRYGKLQGWHGHDGAFD